MKVNTYLHPSLEVTSAGPTNLNGCAFNAVNTYFKTTAKMFFKDAMLIEVKPACTCVLHVLVPHRKPRFINAHSCDPCTIA